MSLNGLDDPTIVDAHETATSEPGGWFLLKYSNRDEVQLLSRGNGGIVEMRSAVSNYDETSPLYGFLKYRRRNVVIKYLPEDCSRLIQARVAVHFNAICERFSPYDAMFEITTPGELIDTKLSLACSLHAASCSTSSSSSSLRRRRLMEIAEEEEEEQRASKRQSIEEPTYDRPRSPAASSAADPVALDSHLAAFPEHSKFSAYSTLELPTFVGADNRPTSSAKSMDVDPNLSYASFPYGKPKVKLGPRPSLEVSGRPRTAGNFRPISAIPAGFKLFGKGSKKAKKDRNSTIVASQEAPASVTSDPSAIATSEDVQPARGKAASLHASSGVSADLSLMPPTQSTSTKKPAVSPEKARLMKAMQLRQKKKMMDLRSHSDAHSLNDLPPEAGELDHTAHKTEMGPESEHKEDHLAQADDGAVAAPASSSAHTDQTSDLTQTDSRPVSPLVALSEADQSTKASSLSESTHETPRAEDRAPALGNGATLRIPPKDNANDDEHAPAAHAPRSETAPLRVSEGKADEGAPESPREAAPASEARAAGARRPQNEPAEKSDAEAANLAAAPNPSTAATELLSAPQAISDRSTSSQNEGEKHKITSLPISKFSVVDIPPSPKLPQEAVPSHADPETPEIPAPTSAGDATTTDASEDPASRQQNLSISPTSPQASAAPTTVIAASVASFGTSQPPPVSVQTNSSDRAPQQIASEADSTAAQRGQPKRKGHIEPIRTDLAQHSRQTSHSGANFSDDEELMEELRSATLQEAKPMLVAKTPVSTTFSTSPTKGRAAANAHVVRTVSNPVRGNLTAPTDPQQPQQPQQQQLQLPGASLVRKSNIGGSSVSQRIKALEKLSAATGDGGAANSRERPSSTFFAVKKREPSRSPSVMERANSLRRGIPDSRPQSKDSSSESGRVSRQERSGSVSDRLSIFEAPTGANALSRPPSSSRRGRPESVSVTAKIVRDSSQGLQTGLEPPRDPSEYSRLELKQSPLVVDRQTAIPEVVPAPAAKPAAERRSASEERAKPIKSRQSSLSIVKDFIKERRKSVTSNQGDASAAAASSRSPSRSPPVQQGSTFSPRLSISSHRSSLSRDRDSVTSPTGESFGGDDGKSANGDKKLSRAGRFMRRLSNLSGSRSKNSPTGIAHAVAEEVPEPEIPRPATTGSPTVVSYMGDVNVQFPDTLLWKRRNLSLDSQGFLILNALPAQSGRQALGIKRYHLSEFRPPYIPDVEIQELPNSVVLDFIEGASIQIACEDRAGQANVLGILREAHGTRGSTYGL
ncbi:hypothetical protein CDD83_3210 [Cordyceps sp. RAO-2017]|nr:hypothetical protein CDD83_3210 [Cordyceps sp. RAO-2017]